jgi:hypothetical protein
MGAHRPPSRHKDPPQNLGLELPNEDVLFLDEDSEDDFGFEIGIDNAHKKRGHNAKNRKVESDDSFDRNSSGHVDGIQMVEDFNAQDFLNSSGKR